MHMILFLNLVTTTTKVEGTIPILQLRKLRSGEVKYLTQDYMSVKEQGQTYPAISPLCLLPAGMLNMVFRFGLP